MSSLDSRQLRALASARKRPLSAHLGNISPALSSRLLSFYEANKHKNVLGDAIRNRACRNLSVEDTAYLSENYSQVEIQGLVDGGDPECRQDYRKPLDNLAVEAVERLVGPCYRTRISCLNPGASIGRHIDDPRQLRVIAILSGAHHFLIHGKQGAHDLPMRIGELWFVNTAFEHEVLNRGNMERIALLANLCELPEVLR
jgi:hypothetical protein